MAEEIGAEAHENIDISVVVDVLQISPFGMGGDDGIQRLLGLHREGKADRAFVRKEIPVIGGGALRARRLEVEAGNDGGDRVSRWVGSRAGIILNIHSTASFVTSCPVGSPAIFVQRK